MTTAINKTFRNRAIYIIRYAKIFTFKTYPMVISKFQQQQKLQLDFSKCCTASLLEEEHAKNNLTAVYPGYSKC